MSANEKPLGLVPNPQRDPLGRLMKGHTANPKGINNMREVDRTLNSEIAQLSRSILQGKGARGKTLFETRIKQVLEPVWYVYSTGRKGKTRSKPGLRNGDVILRCIEFLVNRGYGHEPGPIDDEMQKNLGGMIVVVHAPRPQWPGFPETTARTIDSKRT